MFLTIHALFALIFAKFIPNPFWAFLFGFASHLILDAIPHGDKEVYEWSDERRRKIMPRLALVDGLIMLASLYFLQKNLQLPLVSGVALILGAITPDAISGVLILFFKKPFNNPWEKIHTFCHLLFKKKPISFKIGVWVQLLMLIASIYLLTLLYR